MPEKLDPKAKNVLDKIAAYEDFDSRDPEDWKRTEQEADEHAAALADIFEASRPKKPML